MKKLFILVLTLCLLLAACASGDQPETTDITTQPTENTAPTTRPTEPATRPTETEPATQPSETVPETSAPTEPVPVTYRNPLTGEAMAAPMTVRPYAVVINNSKVAMPQWGIGQADVVYEFCAEGGTTRHMAVFSDLSNVGKLGPNRSARPYSLSLAMGYDAILHHAGACWWGYEELKDTGWDHLDGVWGKNAESYYHRDQTRLDSGIDLEHTMYTTGAEALAYADYIGVTEIRSNPLDYGFRFSEDGTPAGGESAEIITVAFKGGYKTTKMTYRADTGLYAGYQHGMNWVDGNDGQTLSFRNIVVISTGVRIFNDDGRLEMDLTGSGDGYFACGGKIVPIRWSRSSRYDPFTYTLTDGTPVTFGVGKTYIAVVPTGVPVEYC